MILVTGASGFLGRATLAQINSIDSGVLAPSSSELDLTDVDQVEAYFAAHRPEVVVHLAARVGGITANIAEPADFLIDNVSMDTNVLRASVKHRPKHLITVLSTCMYPDRLPDEAYPMSEDQIEDGPPPPTNASYAAAKRTLMHGTSALHQQYGVPYSALIPSNLYGPGDHFDSGRSHFVAAAITKLERARQSGLQEVEFFGTGRALRQYVFVGDVARVIARLIRNGPIGTSVNVAPVQNRSIRDLAHAVAHAVGFEGDVVFTGEGPDGQIRKDVGTKRLLDIVTDWPELETDFETGLRSTIEWYRDHVEAG